jgi:hypothetical protein
MTIRLYEIPIEANDIESSLADNGGELTPEIEQRIADFLSQGKDKIEAAAVVVKSIQADAAICKAESTRLSQRAASLENAADRLKGMMLFAIDEGFGGKVKTAKFTIWGQNSADTVHFEFAPGADIYKLAAAAPCFIRATDPELDKKALKDARDAGIALPECLVVNELPGTRFLRGSNNWRH